MKFFLEQVVEKIASQKLSDHVVFVLPSRRAGIFLKESWIRFFEGDATWLPEIITIEEFMETVSGLKQLDTTTLFFEFYQAYTQTNHTPEPFESFLKWIPTVIADCNDIDRNVIETTKFFDYITSIERMDHWEPQDLDYETDLIKERLLFWKQIEKMYHRVHQNLKKRSLGYQGMVFRSAYENLEFYIKKNTKQHFVFAGFNALTKAEERIIQYLKAEGRASVFWDADDYYLNDITQEAGTFLREIKKWTLYDREPFSFVEKILSEKKNIHVIGTPKQVGQVKLAGTLLQSLTEKKEVLTNTAYVLADENLLEPALNALPDSIEKINVTMGYPLRNIPLSHFFSSLVRLHVNYAKFNQKAFHYEDVLTFLKNSYTDYLLENRLTVIEDLVEQNNVFIAAETLENVSPIFHTLFSDIENRTPFQLIERIKSIISYLSKNSSLKENALEMEYLFRFATLWENLGILVQQFSFVTDYKVLQIIYNQILFHETLSFYGEPLKGLQLMGMLETRLLDFKNVIVTSVNEGILPRGRTENTFIPFDVRKNIGLPTFQENDAIFAYHFYRLIQRAENVYLIYNTENDEYGTGEKSRFLTQLEVELPYAVKHHIAAESTREKVVEPLRIEKSPEMMQTLAEIAEKGFSPSALNSYIRNPLIFYYQNVLKLQDVEEIEETIDAKTLGITIHNSLEELYQPYLNEVLTVEILQKMQKQLEKVLQYHFTEVYKNGDYSKGKNLLIYQVAKRFVYNFLQYEKEEISRGNEIVVKQLEIELKAPFDLDGRTVNIRGFADRIDQYNGVTRVIDYKTGVAESGKLKLKDFEEIIVSKDYDKALQLLLYVYMYHDQFQEDKVSAGIISFRKLKEGVMLLNINQNTVLSKEDLEDFKPELKKLLQEILNEQIPIIETVEET